MIETEIIVMYRKNIFGHIYMLIHCIVRIRGIHAYSFNIYPDGEKSAHDIIHAMAEDDRENVVRIKL